MYTSLHFDYDINDTVDLQNTEIEYNGDSVMLSTYRILDNSEILYKIVRHYDQGRLINDIKYQYQNGGIIYSKEVAYEYLNSELLRKITDLKIDSVFRQENKVRDIRTYNRSGAENIISAKETFKYDGNRISENHEDYVTYKYEGGKGNAVQLFNDPFEQLIGLPHDPGFGW